MYWKSILGKGLAKGKKEKEGLVSFVHIGCTSEDINNPSYANMISGALSEVWVPAAEKLISSISEIAVKYADTPMLAHTHGQPATPTTVGKEFAVYAIRLQESLDNVKSIKIRAKFNGQQETMQQFLWHFQI